MKLRHAILALAACVCASSASAGEDAAVAAFSVAHAAAKDAGWERIVVDAIPTAISHKAGNGAHYGRLIFRGGLELKSKNALFGGWSGIEVDGEGRFIAVSDAGVFLKGRLSLSKNGDLAGIQDSQIAILRDERGQPIDGKSAQDAEDITRLPDGRYAVNFENNHRIEIFDLDGKGPIAGSVPGPPVPKNMIPNEGIEALTLAADGDLLAGREFTANQKPPTQFFKLKMDGSGMVSGPAQIDSNYGLVSMRRLADGDYLALERFYFPLIGVRTVVRRYRGEGLLAKTPHLSGPMLAKLQKPLLLDNFEGLAVVESPGAPARLYLISDNNYNTSSKTLLYAFDLAR